MNFWLDPSKLKLVPWIELIRAKLAGVNLPEKDREGQPIIFDSYDMSPILFGAGKAARKSWF